MSDLAKLKSIESFVLKTLIARIQAIPVISGKIVLKHSKTGIDNNSNETTNFLTIQLLPNNPKSDDIRMI